MRSKEKILIFQTHQLKVLRTGWRLQPGLSDFSGKNVPNEHKMYGTVIKYPKYPRNIPNGYKIYQHFPIWGPIFYPNWDFWFENKHIWQTWLQLHVLVYGAQ
jgi:hypothetical protein